MRMLRALTVAILLLGGMVFIEAPAAAAPPGWVRLETWWHSGRGDNFSVVKKEDREAAERAGYVRIRTEGHVYPHYEVGEDRTGLFLFWHRGRGDNFSTATSEGGAAAVNAGYDKPGLRVMCRTLG